MQQNILCCDKIITTWLSQKKSNALGAEVVLTDLTIYFNVK